MIRARSQVEIITLECRAGISLCDRVESLLENETRFIGMGADGIGQAVTDGGKGFFRVALQLNEGHCEDGARLIHNHRIGDHWVGRSGVHRH